MAAKFVLYTRECTSLYTVFTFWPLGDRKCCVFSTHLALHVWQQGRTSKHLQVGKPKPSHAEALPSVYCHQVVVLHFPTQRYPALGLGYTAAAHVNRTILLKARRAVRLPCGI